MLERMLPYFRVYAAELLSDENFAGWTVAERGAWFTLICICWREGSIPSDKGKLGRVLHLDDAAMATLWGAIGDRFVPHPDNPERLTSRRLEMEREEAEKTIEQKSDAGKKGATSRWSKVKTKHSNTITPPLRSQSASDATPMRFDGPQPNPTQPSPNPTTVVVRAREDAQAAASPTPASGGGDGTGRAGTADPSPPQTPEGLRVEVSQRLGLMGPGGSGLPWPGGKTIGRCTRAAAEAVQRCGFEFTAIACDVFGKQSIADKVIPETFGFFTFFLEKLKPAPQQHRRAADLPAAPVTDDRWGLVLGRLQERLRPDLFEHWIAPLVGHVNGSVVLTSPDAYHAEFVRCN